MLPELVYVTPFLSGGLTAIAVAWSRRAGRSRPMEDAAPPRSFEERRAEWWDALMHASAAAERQPGSFVDAVKRTSEAFEQSPAAAQPIWDADPAPIIAAALKPLGEVSVQLATSSQPATPPEPPDKATVSWPADVTALRGKVGEILAGPAVQTALRDAVSAHANAWVAWWIEAVKGQDSLLIAKLGMLGPTPEMLGAEWKAHIKAVLPLLAKPVVEGHLDQALALALERLPFAEAPPEASATPIAPPRGDALHAARLSDLCDLEQLATTISESPAFRTAWQDMLDNLRPAETVAYTAEMSMVGGQLDALALLLTRAEERLERKETTTQATAETAGFAWLSELVWGGVVALVTAAGFWSAGLY